MDIRNLALLESLWEDLGRNFPQKYLVSSVIQLLGPFEDTFVCDQQLSRKSIWHLSGPAEYPPD